MITVGKIAPAIAQGAVAPQSHEVAAPAPESVPGQRNLKDTRYTEAIVGSWAYATTLADGTIMEGTDRYDRDGYGFAAGSIHKDGGTVAVRAGCKWYVRDGYLYSEIETSNYPFMPVGRMTSARIVSISGKTIDPTTGDKEVYSRIEQTILVPSFRRYLCPVNGVL